MTELIIGAFRVDWWDECTESDARYGHDDPSYRSSMNIYFKDPEDTWLPFDEGGYEQNNGWTLIKAKLYFDGTKEQALDWARNYISKLSDNSEELKKAAYKGAEAAFALIEAHASISERRDFDADKVRQNVKETSERLKLD